jgi:uncharacterized protein with von Willebrand factor type A (vWA) domain
MKDNTFDPQAWTLSGMRQHCSRIIWLNPEPRRDWNQGDSVMADYALSCDHVLECWTLEHLKQAADLLLSTSGLRRDATINLRSDRLLPIAARGAAP